MAWLNPTPNQLGLQIVQTREVSGSVYQAVSQCGIHLLRQPNWLGQSSSLSGRGW
jgi:hypothetical protein